VALFGVVGRKTGGALVTLALDDPGEIAANQTWKQVVTADVPAPSFGTLHWRVAATRAGPRVTADASTERRPLLLLALTTLFVVDLSFLGIRQRMRRHARRDRGGDLQ
jgi:hypothetical protein